MYIKTDYQLQKELNCTKMKRVYMLKNIFCIIKISSSYAEFRLKNLYKVSITVHTGKKNLKRQSFISEYFLYNPS